MFEELIDAIIMQAVEDYRNAKSKRRINEVERFFRSGWFRELSELDGEKIIELLRSERNEQKGNCRKGA